MYNGETEEEYHEIEKSFTWVVLAAALILVNAAAANAQDKATENGQTVQTMTVK